MGGWASGEGANSVDRGPCCADGARCGGGRDKSGRTRGRAGGDEQRACRRTQWRSADAAPPTARGIDRAGREKRRMLPISLFRHFHANPEDPAPAPPAGPPAPVDSRRGAAGFTRGVPPSSRLRGGSARSALCGARPTRRSWSAATGYMI